jgi:hypothetical protein
MTTYTTDNISQLQATECPGGWVVRFRSDNAGLCHQLYANGQLEDFSDSPAQRELLCSDRGGRVQLAVVAVDYASRGEDLSQDMGMAPPEWVFRQKVARSMSLRRGDRLELLWDAASGTMQDTPLLSEDAWPVFMHRQAFGEEFFGQEALGGSVVAGPDIVLQWTVQRAGTYRFVVRTRDAWGRVADSPSITFVAHCPVDVSRTLRAASFDPLSSALTFSV